MSDPYASHLPTLKFVLALVKPRLVLELGAGLYSTKAFLDCPSVERVRSIETDREWAKRVQDERLTMRVVDDTVAELPHNLMDYDLVFIDNADNPADRERAIRAVLGREHPVTVIHDAEVYAAAITEGAANFMVFNSLVPNTAVCW